MAGDRLPVAVTGRPPRSVACRSRISVFRATADPAISSALEIIGDSDRGLNGRRLLPQRPQTVEGEQRPGWLNPAEPLLHLRVT